MSLKISFTGDLMALLPQNNASLDKKTGIYNYDRIFEKVAYVLKDSD